MCKTRSATSSDLNKCNRCCSFGTKVLSVTRKDPQVRGCTCSPLITASAVKFSATEHAEGWSDASWVAPAFHPVGFSLECLLRLEQNSEVHEKDIVREAPVDTIFFRCPHPALEGP